MTGTKVAAAVTRTAGLWAVAALIADQATKIWVRHALDVCPGQPIEACDRVTIAGPVGLLRMENRGGAFGLHQGIDLWLVLTVVGFAVAVWLLRRARSRSMGLAAGLLIGGTAGNAIDRIVGGGVTDFIDPGSVVIFNLADGALIVGAMLGSFILAWGSQPTSSVGSAPIT